MIYLTRKEHFNAAHRLHNPAWSAERNKAVFGLCNNENFHGHNYELIVSVKGLIHPETGFVMDMKELKLIINTEIIDVFDQNIVAFYVRQIRQQGSVSSWTTNRLLILS